MTVQSLTRRSNEDGFAWYASTAAERLAETLWRPGTARSSSSTGAGAGAAMDMAARARVRREAKSIVKDELEAGDGS